MTTKKRITCNMNDSSELIKVNLLRLRRYLIVHGSPAKKRDITIYKLITTINYTHKRNY